MDMNWLNGICHNVLFDMERHGLCVIDNFLQGSCFAHLNKADQVWNEVMSLYQSTEFKEGGLVNDSVRGSTGIKIRDDKMAWIEGTEPICAEIGFLIRILDSIITGCNNLSVTMSCPNVISRRCVKTRTKAMVACYPGSGSQYIRHVDNPNKDGRCITAIYYLNRDWNKDSHGGILRLFPLGTQIVANIEPIFDRLIFFWSDRRNPHEVTATFNNYHRFAITVWYFDSEERKEYINKDANGIFLSDPQLWPFQAKLT